MSGRLTALFFLSLLTSSLNAADEHLKGKWDPLMQWNQIPVSGQPSTLVAVGGENAHVLHTGLDGKPKVMIVDIHGSNPYILFDPESGTISNVYYGSSQHSVHCSGHITLEPV